MLTPWAQRRSNELRIPRTATIHILSAMSVRTSIIVWSRNASFTEPDCQMPLDRLAELAGKIVYNSVVHCNLFKLQLNGRISAKHGYSDFTRFFHGSSTVPIKP